MHTLQLMYSCKGKSSFHGFEVHIFKAQPTAVIDAQERLKGMMALQAEAEEMLQGLACLRARQGEVHSMQQDQQLALADLQVQLPLSS